MYYSYPPDLVRIRQQELIAEADRRRVARAARRARRERRALATRLADADVEIDVEIDEPRRTTRPVLPVRA